MTKRPLEIPLCIVCQDEIEEDNKITTKCWHYYCVTCFVYHMRVSNVCAMCRSEIVPAKPKELPVMDSSIVMNITDFIMRSFVYESGLSNMYLNLTNKFDALLGKFLRTGNIRLTRGTTEIIEKCKEIINGDIRLEYDLWMYTLKCVKSVGKWYEDDNPVFTSPLYINPSTLIDHTQSDSDEDGSVS